MNMDTEVNAILMQLVDYQISEWKGENEDTEGEDTASNNGCSHNKSDPPIRKLFIGNLSRQTTYVHLRKLFSSYGKIVDSYVSRDRITHAKKNFGFVTFRNPEDAERVLKLEKGEFSLHQRILHVAPADSWHQPVELADGTIRWHNRQRRGSEDSAKNREEEAAVGGTVVPSEQEGINVTEDKEEVEMGECKINILNDDCLRHVFSFLNNKERIRIERVCKRWQILTMDMWLCQKHLDFSSLLQPSSKYVINMYILELFLRRCGENLFSLDVSVRPNNFTANVPKVIATYCKNLHCLNLSGLPLTTYSLKCLASVCGEVRYLCMNSCSGVSDKDYQTLFRACPRLETVSLARNTNINGKCLYGLNETPVKHLVLDECNNLRPKNLINALRQLKHLAHISLNTCVNLSTTDLCTLTETVPGLQSLSLAQYFPLLRSSALKTLGSLHDLVRLNLQLNPSVNDEVMESIAHNCKKLEELNITGCSVHSWENTTLTDKGVKCLASLPNLLDLKMSYLASVTDESLETIACKCNLHTLVCRGCPTFNDVGCTRIITCCNELELFDFSGCDLVSNLTVGAALDAVKLRTNNIKLKLVVGGTCVYEDRSMEEHPLLDVDFTDLCVPHLRPDYVDDIYFPSSNDDDDSFIDSDDMVDHILEEWEFDCEEGYGFEMEDCVYQW